MSILNWNKLHDLTEHEPDGGLVVQRLNYRFRDNPYIAIFGKDTIDAMAVMIGRHVSNADWTWVVGMSPETFRTEVKTALTNSPFGRMLTNEFMAEIAREAAVAVFPETLRGSYYD